MEPRTGALGRAVITCLLTGLLAACSDDDRAPAASTPPPDPGPFEGLSFEVVQSTTLGDVQAELVPLALDRAELAIEGGTPPYTASVVADPEEALADRFVYDAENTAIGPTGKPNSNITRSTCSGEAPSISSQPLSMPKG